jgi:hypothetical protein
MRPTSRDIPADLNPDTPCAREGGTWKLLVNARWLPEGLVVGGTTPSPTKIGQLKSRRSLGMTLRVLNTDPRRGDS